MFLGCPISTHFLPSYVCLRSGHSGAAGRSLVRMPAGKQVLTWALGIREVEYIMNHKEKDIRSQCDIS